MTRKVLLFAIVLAGCISPVRPSAAGLQSEPSVRIGLNQDAATLTVRSAQSFSIETQQTRSAKFSTALAVDSSGSARPMQKADLQYRMVVELDGGRILVLPLTTKVRIQPNGARIEIGDRSYRGVIEVFGNSRSTFTAVNELPLEEYLLGVVPNELSPTTFGEIEALKAQAVAARTYIVRNLGQFRGENYDICATDSCQVYFGAGTEHPLATAAVEQTRGIVAMYDSKPISALYSSTCGGRTESSENIFTEKLPYLVSTACEYKHPEPKPFSTTQLNDSFEAAVLKVAGVSNYTEARRFMSLPGTGEPASTAKPGLAAFVRQNFYPTLKPASDLDFLIEQGILSGAGEIPQKTILYRLIEKKSAFEWQQGILVSWDGQTMKLMLNGQPREFQLSPDAPIFNRIGDDRVATKSGAWIGGELIDFRALDDMIQMVVYRRNWVNPSADRYSRLAIWQTHKTRQELDTAFQALNIGGLKGIRVIERGASQRPISTEISGTRRAETVRALRLRTLLGLRDSQFYFDEERNSRGELVGITFYGSGWGHGVGMCQVGAYGMALEGATYDQILKKYYQGIELKRTY